VEQTDCLSGEDRLHSQYMISDKLDRSDMCWFLQSRPSDTKPHCPQFGGTFQVSSHYQSQTEHGPHFQLNRHFKFASVFHCTDEWKGYIRRHKLEWELSNCWVEIADGFILFFSYFGYQSRRKRWDGHVARMGENKIA
jgi:hypothetical protein